MASSHFVPQESIPEDLSSPRIAPYKLIYTVPRSHLSATKNAIFTVPGAGFYYGGPSSSSQSTPQPLYTHVSFETQGIGHFRPTPSANPAIGQAGGAEENVDELQVNIICRGLECARKAVAELTKAHPYESVAYEVTRCEII